MRDSLHQRLAPLPLSAPRRIPEPDVAECKSAHMRQPGHSPAASHDRHQKLIEKPETEKKFCRDTHDLYKKQEDHGKDPCMRIQYQIRPQNPGDRARCPHQGHLRIGAEHDKQHHRRQTGSDIEYDKFHRAEKILYIVAEYPEE